jgi:hypothetical protein
MEMIKGMDDYSDDYSAWLKKHPAPDLHELVERYRRYDLIPPEAWIDFDLRMEVWRGPSRHEL